MKKAIIQCADTGPLESLVVMLKTAGYECYRPSERLLGQLRGIGLDTVLSVSDLVTGMGYDRPFEMPTAHPMDMRDADLYVDVKAHRGYDKIVKEWPNLKGKVLWYRINGGCPEHVINERGDHGDEVNPPCPVLTPNQWYADKWFGQPSDGGIDWCGAEGRAYAFWPPFYRVDDYFPQYGRSHPRYADPICLIHNVEGWGYRDMLAPVRKLGVKVYGRGSPDGLIPHRDVPGALASAVAMVHLKSNDAPGYAIYEAMAAGCPVICSRRLIWRCRMQDLLIPGKTCLVFDRETHDALTPDDVRTCTAEIHAYLDQLRTDPTLNMEIGMGGRARLKEVVWDAGRDGDALRSFMSRNFP